MNQPLWPRLQHTVFTESGDAPKSLWAFVQGLSGGAALRAHSERVAGFALEIGQAWGFPNSDLQRLHLAGLLHDCGKITLTSAVLDKAGPLSWHERLYMETHALAGAALLKETPDLADLAPAVRHHHERWDGRGYPKGVSGDKIPIFSRIIAVADAFDAITSPRPYSVDLTTAQGFGILMSEQGLHFDPDVVDAFASCYEVSRELLMLRAA